MDIVLHGKEGECSDQGHHGLAMGSGLGHDMYHRCIIAMKKQVFSFEVRSPQSQSHGNSIKLMPVNAHLLVLEGLLGEGTLTPLTLKVTPIALVAGIGEQLHIWAAGPICIIQVADPIPGWQVGQPPLNIGSELCIQLDTVMQVACFLGHLYHPAQECSDLGGIPCKQNEAC